MKSFNAKKIFSLFVATLLFSSHCFAFELDTSVDEEIRKNYNPSALEQNLPVLPKTAPSQSTTTTTTNKTTPAVPKTQPISQPSKPQLVIKKWIMIISLINQPQSELKKVQGLELSQIVLYQIIKEKEPEFRLLL